MAERFIFSWKDEAEEARFKAIAAFEGVTMSEMMHRVIAQIPVIGKVDSARGKVTGAFQGNVSDLKTFDHALTTAELILNFAESGKVTLVQADGECMTIEEELARR